MNIIRELSNSHAQPTQLHYDTEEEFFNDIDFFCTDKCSCGGFNEVAFEQVHITIERYSITTDCIPMLRCTKCNKKNIPELTKQIIIEAYQQLKNRGALSVELKPNGYSQRYAYAEKGDYIYDHWDYECIPGLKFDEEHQEKGFLTPVYFDKRVLISFFNLPSYEVNLFSESYGCFSMFSQPNGDYEYEWSIPFGINSSGKVVFWLGDLSRIIDDTTIYLLKAFNVNSDHLLTASEFYQAQMCCLFSEPIAEKQIILFRQSFINNIKGKYGIDLSHLDEESHKYVQTIRRPVVFTQSTVSEIINTYDKILVEGLNVDALRQLYETLVDSAKRAKEYRKWQSIKLLEGILYALCVSVGMDIDVETVISPLYILHDYRILLDHLLPNEKQDETKKHIISTLMVKTFDEQEAICLEEIRRLKKLFTLLNILTK